MPFVAKFCTVRESKSYFFSADIEKDDRRPTAYAKQPIAF